MARQKAALNNTVHNAVGSESSDTANNGANKSSSYAVKKSTYSASCDTENKAANDAVNHAANNTENKTNSSDAKGDKGNAGGTETRKKEKAVVVGGLKELTEQWMQMERKTLEQRKNAARFYDEYLMKLIEEEFIHNNQDMVFEDVEYMIISVGTSYEPIVLDIQLLRPGKLLFLYTEASRDTTLFRVFCVHQSY